MWPSPSLWPGGPGLTHPAHHCHPPLAPTAPYPSGPPGPAVRSLFPIPPNHLGEAPTDGSSRSARQGERAPLVGGWSLPGFRGAARLGEAHTLQLPARRLLPLPPLDVDSLFSVTRRDSCATAHTPKGSSVAPFPSIILKMSFVDSKRTGCPSITDAPRAVTRFRCSRGTPLRNGSRTPAAGRLKRFTCGAGNVTGLFK